MRNTQSDRHWVSTRILPQLMTHPDSAIEHCFACPAVIVLPTLTTFFHILPRQENRRDDRQAIIGLLLPAETSMSEAVMTPRQSGGLSAEKQTRPPKAQSGYKFTRLP